jgi:hypothetical protein
MITDMDNSKLSRNSASFALAATISILVNTVLACAKDASPPLKAWMASLTGHDWTTQGIAVVFLFGLLGLILQKTDIAEHMPASRIISFLVAATLVAAVGLFAWYALY